MAEFYRKAGVLWSGDLKSGSGVISTESKAIFELPFDYQTRFEDKVGLNPEELIAAAHAACFSMSVAKTLKESRFEPMRMDTTATCTLVSKNASDEITKLQLHVRGEAPGLDEATFNKLVMQADRSCPVSNISRNGLKIEITTTLV